MNIADCKYIQFKSDFANSQNIDFVHRYQIIFFYSFFHNTQQLSLYLFLYFISYHNVYIKACLIISYEVQAFAGISFQKSKGFNFFRVLIFKHSRILCLLVFGNKIKYLVIIIIIIIFI